MGQNAHTPGPWDYVPSTEHHGPYVITEYGSTVCDCYYMSNPTALSVRNGGDSKPIHHMHEMADANARLIAAAPEMFDALAKLLEQWEAFEAGYGNQEEAYYKLAKYARPHWEAARAAIAKAQPASEGE